MRVIPVTHARDTCDVSFIRDFTFTEFLAGKFVMFGEEDKMAPVKPSCYQRAFLFTNTRLFYVIATG